MSIVMMASIGQPQNLHVMVGIFSLDNLYSARERPLLVRDMLVNLGSSYHKQAKAVHAWIWVGIPT